MVEADCVAEFMHHGEVIEIPERLRVGRRDLHPDVALDAILVGDRILRLKGEPERAIVRVVVVGEQQDRGISGASRIHRLEGDICDVGKQRDDHLVAGALDVGAL